MTVRCPEARSYLHPFLDGELEVDANVAVLRHLDLCAACRARFEDERRLLARVKEGLAERCPEALKAKIFASLSSEEAPAARRRSVVTWPRLAAAAAALVIAFVYLDPICLRGCPTVRALSQEHRAAGTTLSEDEALAAARKVLGRDEVKCQQLCDGSWCCQGVRSLGCATAGCIVRFACKKRGTISFVKYPGGDVHPWLRRSAGEHGLFVTRQDGCRFAGWSEGDCLYGVVADEGLPPEQLLAIAAKLRVEK